MKECHIVGGGTSSWMLAYALLIRTEYKVTLINSDKIEKIGVGESTVPLMMHFLDFCKINFTEFIIKTGASIKLGIVYTGWRQDGVEFEHLFGGKWYDANVLGISKLKYDKMNRYLTDSYYHIQENTIANDLLSSTRGFALHFSAEKVVDFFLEKCKEHDNFMFISDHITDVEFDENDKVKTLKTEHRDIPVEFLFDCTGFNGLLNKIVDNKWVDSSELLFNNRAIVLRRPYKEKENIRNYTENKRMDYGWRWQIHLQNDISYGYVFSSKYINFDEAEEELRKELVEFSEIPIARKLEFKSGYYETILHKNYCLIGLSAGFFEPIEATHLGVVQRQIIAIVNHMLTDKLQLPSYQKIYNKHMINYNNQIKNFIGMIYQFCEFDHTDYWKDVQKRKHDSLSLILKNMENTTGFDLMFGKLDITQILNGYNVPMGIPIDNWEHLYVPEESPSGALEFYENDQKKINKFF